MVPDELSKNWQQWLRDLQRLEEFCVNRQCVNRQCVYHFASGHSGREYVLPLLRSKFWVIRANSVVRKLLANCFSCRRRPAPVCSQKMADLPKERVTRGQPLFSHVGIDFFGPFMEKQGRSQVKRHGCIFTRLTIRAVHLEIAHSLDTDSFINAISSGEEARLCW